MANQIQKGSGQTIRTANFRIFLCTWNVGTQDPPESFAEVLGLNKQQLPDIYGIGLQEVSSGDSDTENNLWVTAITDTLAPKGYVRIKTVRMQGILLTAFVKRNMLLTYTQIESEKSKAGLAGWWGNKGGVSVRFDVNGVNLIIVNAHLAAHMDNAVERIEDFFTILDTQRFRDDDVENILDHDYIFWIGDLNFRLDNVSRSYVEEKIEKQEYEDLLVNDQLINCRQEELVFADFEEGKIRFAPTYKFDMGTDTYDTSTKQRIPAWCDRVLWMVHEDSFQNIELEAKQLHYTSHPSYRTSDHKPVTSEFDIQVFPHPPKPPCVVFRVPDEWILGTDVDFQYTYRDDYATGSSSWDWIGLYHCEFKHFNDYVSYIYADSDADKTGKSGVTLTFSLKGSKFSFKTRPGRYMLCYISRVKDTLMGISQEFRILPEKEADIW